MNYLTMVMRSGDIKGKDSAFMYTLIGDNMQKVCMSGAELAEGIAAKKYVVTNMDVTTRGLVSTNGALKNYTTVGLDGALIGTPKAVILSRVEKDNKLIGYVIYNINATISDISVADAAALAANGMIANGKIRHTSEGDIVSAIGGNYPLKQAKTRKVAPKITVDVTIFHQVVKGKKDVKCAGIMLDSNNALTLSKLYTTLEPKNKELCETLSDMGYGDTASLGIIRGGTGGFYGVYPIELVNELIGKADKVVNSFGGIIVSCKDISESPAKESAAVLDKKKLSIDKHQKGSELSDAKIKGFLKSVKETLETVTIN